jgi:hypothetical protein
MNGGTVYVISAGRVAYETKAAAEGVAIDGDSVEFGAAVLRRERVIGEGLTLRIARLGVMVRAIAIGDGMAVHRDPEPVWESDRWAVSDIASGARVTAGWSRRRSAVKAAHLRLRRRGGRDVADLHAVAVALAYPEDVGGEVRS